ncbi:MAG: glycosyl hydrolase family 18 protein [Ignavibacteriales bacterium]
MKKLLLLMLLFLAAGINVSAKSISVGYYNGYYERYPYTAFQFENLTNICHAFIYLSSDGSLNTSGSSDPWWFAYPELIKAAHDHGVKVSISVGGWRPISPTDTNFSKMAASPAARQKFVTNLVNFIKQNGYDGADLDWEYPKSTDMANYTALLTELRQAFNTNGIELLSLAVSATNSTGLDIANIKDKLNWIGLMTYDFTGSWEKYAYHNSPLYSTPKQSGSVDYSVNYYIGKGMPKEKICLGLPFYGYKLNGSDIYGAISGGSSITYANANIARNSGSWDYYWDDVAKAPYMKSKDGKQVISYDDTTSIRLKCEYAKSKGLAGVIMWELHQSYTGSNSPLLETVGKSLLGVTTGVADNVPVIPMGFELKNYPNPFNPSTMINYTVPFTSKVSLRVFDAMGREVRELFSGEKTAGKYQIEFNAQGLPSGIYFCRLLSGSFSTTTKLVLAK